MPEVQRIRENEQEILFAHRPMGGVFIAIIGAGIAWLAWEKGSDSTARWIGLFAGCFFSLIGMGAAFWRYELHLDLLSRVYTRRKGFWPAPKTDQGSFSDIESVTLDVEYRRANSKSSSTSATWQVGLKLRPDARAIGVAEEINEEAAFKAFESLAKKLHVTAVDRTGSEEKIRSWDRLDEALASPIARGAGFASITIPPLPAGSRIELLQMPEGRAIRLPSIGFGLGVMFFLLFGLAFFGFAAFFAWAKLTQAVPIKESSSAAGWFVVGIFAFFGLGIALLGFFGASSREVVREDSGGILFAQYFLGKERLARRVEKREVEEVAIKMARYQSGGSSVRIGGASLPLPQSRSAARMEVVVRSDKHVARLGGDLSPEEREWLRDAISAMLAA